MFFGWVDFLTFYFLIAIIELYSEYMLINTKKITEYLLTTAEHNYKTSRLLLAGKRYPECLFFCHLMIEKILKALVVKYTKTHAPFTHKLVDLAKLAKIHLTEDQVDQLTTITEFNIATRYYEVKFDFYKKCTKAYTEEYFQISKQLYLWLKKQYRQK